MKVRALLLAAGLGTRLRPLTNSVPKCLVDINGRPLLDYWLELLTRGGIQEILVNLHYFPEQVTAYLAKCRHSARITTAFEEELLGTGGTLVKNKAFFEGVSIMLVHADNLSLFDVHGFLERFQSRDVGVEITMMTFYTDVPQTCGIVELDEKGLVTGFHEKVEFPPGNLANAAVYIVAPTVLQFMIGLNKPIIDFSTEVLPAFLGRINTFHNDTYHRDIGSLESLAAAQTEYPVALARQGITDSPPA